MSTPPLAVPQRQLLGANGQPVQTRPPEKVTAVKFIRNLARQQGDIHTPQGQALHRVAAHMIRLQEELERCSRLHDLRGEHTPEILDAAAKGIYGIAQEQMHRTTGKRPDDWEVVTRDRPEEAQMYHHMAIAALGGPIFPPLASPEEMEEARRGQEG